MEDSRFPQPLAPVQAPIRRFMAENAAKALGASGQAVPELVAAGRVPPDVLAGLTLFLIAGQPSRSAAGDEPSRDGARGVGGGVWVREHFTVHAPVPVDAPLQVTGAVQRVYARGGRRYTVTRAETRDSAGRLLVSSCTTGLVRYRKDPDLPDGAEGLDERAISRPEPDPDAAAHNPAADALGALRPGDTVRGPATVVGLDLMRARDGSDSRNPIHTDPEAARRAGLPLPIAAGSHVLSFVQEALMQKLGAEALLHGACTDVRWLSQVRAGAEVIPTAEVVAADGARVDWDLEVQCEGRVAMTGTLRIPLPG